MKKATKKTSTGRTRPKIPPLRTAWGWVAVGLRPNYPGSGLAGAWIQCNFLARTKKAAVKAARDWERRLPTKQMKAMDAAAKKHRIPH